MIRTVIQLDDEQREELRRIAAAQHVSVAELVRRGVDLVIKGEAGCGREERKMRAMEAAGRFSSGKRDIAGKDDEYLAQAYGKQPR